MTQLRPTFGPAVDARDIVAAALGLTAADLAPDLPVQEVSCGVPFLMVPLRSRETVDRAISDAGAFRRLAAATGVNLPIYLFAVLPRGETETVYSRMFAPDFGIVEDPATGGASGPLGSYVVRHRLVDGDGARRIVALQGVAMQRPGRIYITILDRGGEIEDVKVGGTAVLVGRGELLI
jgi:trans-2,3-dihydro-3-hydroxyanthranilate isomerase